MAGQAADRILPGRAKCWFFPEGSGAEGELIGRGAYDCAGVFVKPSFLPCAIKQVLAAPIAGFSHDALGWAFDEMAGELTQPDELLSIFTDGWAMQALAYVACANRRPQPSGTTICSGLTPWQLRRAKELASCGSVGEPVAESRGRGMQAFRQPFREGIQGVNRGSAAPMVGAGTH